MRRLQSIAPPLIHVRGMACLLIIKNLTQRDLEHQIEVRLTETNRDSGCNSRARRVIWERRLPIRDIEMMILIDEELPPGQYRIDVGYQASSVSRVITKYDSNPFILGLPYSAYPPLELYL